VFALKLNRREFAKNSNDLIRRKFSIDAGFGRPTGGRGHIHHFETIPDVPETRRSPSASIEQLRGARKPPDVALFGRGRTRLSVRLISL
jgi:hypothetical protein